MASPWWKTAQFALEVMDHIVDKLNEYKEEDGILYAIYGTPAETLCGKQIDQFRKKYGVIEGVSRPSLCQQLAFHCGVWRRYLAHRETGSGVRGSGIASMAARFSMCSYPHQL